MTPGFRNVGGVLFRRRGYAVGEREISVGSGSVAKVSRPGSCPKG